MIRCTSVEPLRDTENMKIGLIAMLASATAPVVVDLHVLWPHDVADVCGACDTVKVHDQAGASGDELVVDAGVGGEDEGEVDVREGLLEGLLVSPNSVRLGT